jgi:hypothetical protein
LCHFASGNQHDRSSCDDPRVEIVLTTSTPESVTVVLPALVYAKILEEHAAVADLALIDRAVPMPTNAGWIRVRIASDSSVRKLASGFSPWWNSERFLPSS